VSLSNRWEATASTPKQCLTPWVWASLPAWHGREQANVTGIANFASDLSGKTIEFAAGHPS
jgi:hypothetical protein